MKLEYELRNWTMKLNYETGLGIRKLDAIGLYITGVCHRMELDCMAKLRNWTTKENYAIGLCN